MGNRTSGRAPKTQRKNRELTISLKKPPKVLLIGNGLCMALEQKGFGDILWDICNKNRNDLEKEEFKRLSLPFPQKVIVATSDQVNTNMNYLAKGLREIKLSPENREYVLGLIRNADVDAILTTNYSYEIENTLYESYNKSSYIEHRRHTKKEIDESLPDQLHQFIDLSDVGIAAPLWHIHGEAYRPNSMVMGQYYYGRLLGYIRDELQNFFIRKGMAEKAGKTTMAVHSWVDYFLLGDVHILGFGLDPSEMDLWWLINFKKMRFNSTSVWYHNLKMDREEEGKYHLMKACGIQFDEDMEVLFRDAHREQSEYSYRDYYLKVIDSL